MGIEPLTELMMTKYSDVSMCHQASMSWSAAISIGVAGVLDLGQQRMRNRNIQ